MRCSRSGPRSGPRPALLLGSCALACTLELLTATGARAAQPPALVPSSGVVEEIEHEIRVSLAPTGAVLEVRREFRNPGPLHERVELPLQLGCEATLDQVAILESSPDGPRWRAAQILDPDDASARWDAWLAPDPSQGAPVLDADTALLVTRSRYGCEATLELHPVPPMHTRSVAYRVFVPSVHVEGREVIELPKLAGHGQAPIVVLDERGSADYLIRVDDRPVPTTDDGPVELSSDRAHVISLEARDRGHGELRVADLDLDALVKRSPAAVLARAAEDADTRDLPLGHLVETVFAAPAELAHLPEVRRVVVVLDNSRSLDSRQRDSMRELIGVYLDQLEASQRAPIQAEVVVFDRKLRQVYDGFVPVEWVAKDLAKLDLGPDQNGSELDLALAQARALLDDAAAQDRAEQGEQDQDRVDWIVVASDLYLRAAYDLEAESAQAKASTTRVHVLRGVKGGEFRPAPREHEWTALARAAGGMHWEVGASLSPGADLGLELVRPTRIWSLRTELESAAGERAVIGQTEWIAAGDAQTWTDLGRDHDVSRVVVAGEVWGQTRAWTAAPQAEEARRVAGAHATHDEFDLSDAALTALAVHAQVVSPFTSAWALASFGGASPTPNGGFGIGGFGMRGGYSTRCGGARGHGYRTVNHPLSFSDLAAEALAACPDAGPGHFGFETTDDEIVAVAVDAFNGDDACLREAIWALDVRPTQTTGRQEIHVEHDGKAVTELRFGPQPASAP